MYIHTYIIYIYTGIYIYIYLCIYVYVYIQRERESAKYFATMSIYTLVVAPCEYGFLRRAPEGHLDVAVFLQVATSSIHALRF